MKITKGQILKMGEDADILIEDIYINASGRGVEAMVVFKTRVEDRRANPVETTVAQFSIYIDAHKRYLDRVAQKK